MNRRLARVAGLTVLLAGAELLERVAYRAGLDDEALRHGVTAGEALPPKDLRDVDEDLAAVDLSDVVAAHVCVAVVCCEAPA